MILVQFGKKQFPINTCKIFAFCNFIEFRKGIKCRRCGSLIFLYLLYCSFDRHIIKSYIVTLC